MIIDNYRLLNIKESIFDNPPKYFYDILTLYYIINEGFDAEFIIRIKIFKCYTKIVIVNFPLNSNNSGLIPNFLQGKSEYTEHDIKLNDINYRVLLLHNLPNFMFDINSVFFNIFLTDYINYATKE